MNLFHIFSGYDFHLLIKQFRVDDNDIKLNPNTEEKFISFSKILKYDSNKQIQLKFMD